MAIKRKSGGGGGGANWMDTYGDMVTLLLCFFVLLYSMSTISEENWKAIVLSFNPNAKPDQTEVFQGNNTGPSADPIEEGVIPMGDMTQQDVEAALEALYLALKEYSEESGEAQSIDVTKGDGYVFVSFNDAVFFDGESEYLREDGKRVLQAVSEILSKAKGYIDEVRVLGHTAQATANRPNTPARDRSLSSNRATNALVYIQEHSELDPGRLISVGYGQWRPADSNATPDTRAHNRRVEIVITGFDVMNELGDSIQQYNTLRTGGAHLTTDPGTGNTANASSGT